MNTSLFTFIDGLFDIVGKIGTSLWEILTTPVSEYVATWNLSNVFGDGVIGNWISQIIETVLTFFIWRKWHNSFSNTGHDWYNFDC